VYELCFHCNISLLPISGGVLDSLVTDVLNVEARDQHTFKEATSGDSPVNGGVDSLMSMTGEICVVVSISSDSRDRLLHPHMVNITLIKKSEPGA
jgi:hypothetical protein